MKHWEFSKLRREIYSELLNIVDEETQLDIIKDHPGSLVYICNPSENVQICAINNLHYSHFFVLIHVFLDPRNNKISNSKALNLLCKIALDQDKIKIKSHPNYKTDGELILEKIRKIHI